MSSFSVDNLLYQVKNIVTPEILRGASLVLFVLVLFVGIIYLALVISFEKIRNKSSKWCFYIFQFYFLIDLGIALSECTFFSVYYTSFLGCYLFSLFKFMLLTALYALVLFEKWSFKRAVKDRNSLKDKSKTRDNFKDENIENNRENSFISCNEDSYFLNDIEKDGIYKLVDDDKLNLKRDLTEEICPEKESNSSDILNKIFEDQKCGSVCDINIAYVTAVINSLCAKNITIEEREFLNDLKFNLNFSVYKGSEQAKKMNEDFCVLVKKMTEYNLLM